MNARRSDLVARGFLIAAVVLLVLYQTMVDYRIRDPMDDWSDVRGFEVWGMILESFRAGYVDQLMYLMIAGLLIGVVTTLVSPFLVRVLSVSRPIWWLAVSASSLALVSLVGVSMWAHATIDLDGLENFEYGAGYRCFLAFPVANFIGLLCVRGRAAEGDLVESAAKRR